MTLLPVEKVRITVPPQDGWVEAESLVLCCNPACDRRGSQTHHVVRRSETGGPVRWVSVDGIVLLNEHPICLYCHEEINSHGAWIRYVDGLGWVWYAAARGALAEFAEHSDEQVWFQHPKSGRWFRALGVLKGA